MPILFLTGFPGFLGSRLLPRVLAQAPADRLVEFVRAHPEIGSDAMA